MTRIPPIGSVVLCAVLVVLLVCIVVGRVERFATEDSLTDTSTDSLNNALSTFRSSFTPKQFERLQRMTKHKDKMKAFVLGKSPLHGKVNTLVDNVGKAFDAQRKLTRVLHRKRPMDTDAPTVVTLLWSGGLGSTYRLCELLFVHRRTVRPVHLNIKGLDYRTTTDHERDAVRGLDAYLRKHHTAYTDGTRATLLPITMLTDMQPATVDDSDHRLDTLRVRQQLRTFYKSDHVTPFDVALVQLNDKCDACDTHLSARPIEVVLSAGGAHRRLYRIATTTGTSDRPPTKRKPLAEWFGDQPPDPSPDERRIRTTPTYTFPPYEHLRFVTCPTAEVMRETANKYGFADVLSRTWSCSKPQWTPAQKQDLRSQRRYTNVLTTNGIEKRLDPNAPVRVPRPTQTCATCASCVLRGSQGWWQRPVSVEEVNEEEDGGGSPMKAGGLDALMAMMGKTMIEKNK